MAGWWLTYPSEKYEFVKWNDEIPNIWENNPNVPNHQPDGIMDHHVLKPMPYTIYTIPVANRGCHDFYNHSRGIPNSETYSGGSLWHG
jgi:hypothetical protein